MQKRASLISLLFFFFRVVKKYMIWSIKSHHQNRPVSVKNKTRLREENGF